MIRLQLPAFSPLPLRALLRSTRLPRGGAEAALRSLLRERFSVEDALLCGSGTQALQLALRAACRQGSGSSDLVALPAFACYDVASAAIGADVRAVFYDLDPDTLAPDLESLARALQLGPAAVVVAPLFGYQPDWDELRALTGRHGVVLIEDAAQSFGATWHERPIGGVGDFSILSFGRGKGWTAVEGGALMGPERELGPLSASLPSPPPRWAAQVLLKGLAQWGLGRPALYGLPSVMPGLNLGETVFHAPRPPRRLGAVGARLALETEKAADLESATRAMRARALANRLGRQAATTCRLPRLQGGSEPGFLRLPVLVSPGARPGILSKGRRLGVMSSYPRPLPELPEMQPHMAARAPHPGASSLAESLVTIPTHSLVSDQDVGRILALFGSVHD